MRRDSITCRGGLSEAEALEIVCLQLRADPVEEILLGGSSARVFLTRTAAGEQWVVKILVAQTGSVDGHDLQSFRAKLEQTDRITQTAPILGERYIPTTHIFEGGTWACQVTPFYPSTDLAAPLREPGGEDLFFRQSAAVFQALLVKGYGVDSIPAPPGFVDRVVVGRFLRRLPMLERALPEALSFDTLQINGRTCISPRLLLRQILDNRRSRLDMLAPSRLMFCAHGDANTRNLLIGAPKEGNVDFRVIDPRGSTEYWDPVYDIAKSLFSLSVWDLALRLGFHIEGSGATYNVSFRRPFYDGYRSAILRFQSWLDSMPDLNDLFREDRLWRERLVLTHDMHVLAEAPCRLSDRKPKIGGDGRPSSPEELALGFYLVGTLLLNDFAQSLTGGDPLDPADHLSLAWV